MLVWGIALALIGVPVITYFFGKRWYCSWVCGCGALAETLGDPFRQNSSKTDTAWKLEKFIIYPILGFIILLTIGLWTYDFYKLSFLGSSIFSLKKFYGFYIGAIFSGVVGVGFYPILGSRVWCRFGCPMAAVLGICLLYTSPSPRD